MKVRDIVYHGNGMTVAFDDNSVANVVYKIRNGKLELEGLKSSQKTALSNFNNINANNLRLDTRIVDTTKIDSDINEVADGVTETQLDIINLAKVDDDVLQQAKSLSERPPATPDSYGQPLDAIVSNGVATVNLAWTPPGTCKCLVGGIKVGYRTLPSSTLGTILLDVFRLRGGVSQSLLLAPISLETDNLTAEIWKMVPLTNVLGSLYCSDGDYFYTTITSNNADAVDGTGGGIAISYGIC